MLIALLLLQAVIHWSVSFDPAVQVVVGGDAQEGFIRCEDIPKNSSFSLCNPVIVGHERKPDSCGTGPRWVVEHSVEGFRRSSMNMITLQACSRGNPSSYPSSCPTYISVSDHFETKEAAMEFALTLDERAGPNVYKIGECVPLEWETKEVRVKQTSGRWKVK